MAFYGFYGFLWLLGDNRWYIRLVCHCDNLVECFATNRAHNFCASTLLYIAPSLQCCLLKEVTTITTHGDFGKTNERLKGDGALSALLNFVGEVVL